MMYFLMIVGIVVIIYAAILSVVMVQKRQNKVIDQGVSEQTVKNPIIGNPITYLYIGIPILAVIGGLIWWYYKP
ncbi:MAG: hypothetical protein P0Y55_07600 [Candidatus Cohnella colombiensis]|uniref:Uncharacterized protein n=1 Tax=Candidatus Cohnella colombiensis TaxID=3121368 RepID=A0AA95JHD0_9BACL|nr:MAG: hypothetical protein P0Y55_07600 [Cohnella sp.]